MPSPKRILIDPPDEATILATRHLDATEDLVQVGVTVDAATRSAITTVLRYVAKAHNSPAAPALDQPVPTAPLTDTDGRTICTCTHGTPCGCGTSVHYTSQEQPMPTCTATIEGPHTGRDTPVPCALDAHGEEQQHQSAPHGPNKTRLHWTDYHAGATPHGASASKES